MIDSIILMYVDYLWKRKFFGQLKFQKSKKYVIEQFRKKRIDVFDSTKINYEQVLMKRELEKRNIDYVNIEDEKKRGRILSELDEQIPVLPTYDRLVLTKRQK